MKQPVPNNSFQSFILEVSPTDEQKQLVTQYLTDTYGELGETYFYNEEQETLSIETVRTIQQTLAYASRGEKVRHLVLLYADKLSIPAQQALLKILEEPPAYSHIYLVSARPDALLPTIHSRCMLLSLNQNQTYKLSQTDVDEIEELFKTLSQSGYGETINIAERYSSEDKLIILISNISLYFYISMHKSIDKSNNIYINISKNNITTQNMLNISILSQQTLRLLSGNANLKLQSEAYFFGLKEILQ